VKNEVSDTSIHVNCKSPSRACDFDASFGKAAVECASAVLLNAKVVAGGDQCRDALY